MEEVVVGGEVVGGEVVLEDVLVVEGVLEGMLEGVTEGVLVLEEARDRIELTELWMT